MIGGPSHKSITRKAEIFEDFEHYLVHFAPRNPKKGNFDALKMTI